MTNETKNSTKMTGHDIAVEASERMRAQGVSISPHQMESVLKAIRDVIYDGVANGQTVYLRGLCKFDKIVRKGRRISVPKGRGTDIPDRPSVRIRISPSFTKKIRESE